MEQESYPLVPPTCCMRLGFSLAGLPPVTTVGTPKLVNASTKIAQVEGHRPSVSCERPELAEGLGETSG